MIPFKEYYTLLQEDLNNVPKRILGLSTSIIELPDNEPYGFWVDRGGNFLQVPYQGHEMGINKIVDKAKIYLKNQGVEYSPAYRYSDLFNEGWMRVAIADNIYYELGANQVLTTSQRRFLDTIKDLYDKPNIVKE